MGRPGHPTVDDVFAAINNICCGNNPPPQHALSHNNNLSYCSGTGHWRSNCLVLFRDAFLPQPQDQSLSASAYAQSPATNRSTPAICLITGPNPPAVGEALSWLLEQPTTWADISIHSLLWIHSIRIWSWILLLIGCRWWQSIAGAWEYWLGMGFEQFHPSCTAHKWQELSLVLANYSTLVLSHLSTHKPILSYACLIVLSRKICPLSPNLVYCFCYMPRSITPFQSWMTIS